MSIRFKLNTQKIFLGNKEVTKVYKGIKKVYEMRVKTPLEVFMDKWGHIFNSEAAFRSSVRTGEVFEWVCPPDVYYVSVVAVGSAGGSAEASTGGDARFEGDDEVFVRGGGGRGNPGIGGSFTGSGGADGTPGSQWVGGAAGGYNGNYSGGGAAGKGGSFRASGGSVYLYGQGITGTSSSRAGSSDTLRIHKILNESLEIPYFQDQSISGGGDNGGGGGLGWRNNIPVTPGQTYNVYINENGVSGSSGNAALRIVWTPPGMELIREFPKTNVYALVNWYLENNSEFKADYNALTTNI